MKHLIYIGYVLLCTLVLSSCRHKEIQLDINALEGDWSIIEMKEASATELKMVPSPSMSFETETGRLSAFAGCNTILASFQTDSTPGGISFSGLAATRMICPDMTQEKALMELLKKVKQFEVEDSTRATLMDEHKGILIRLEKGAIKDDNAFNKLDGSWDIVRVNGQELPDELEEKPILIFNVTDGTFSGNLSCNHISGVLTLDAGLPQNIKLEQPVITLKTCKQMKTEEAIKSALGKCTTFQIDDNGSLLILCDDKGNHLLELIPEDAGTEEHD